MSGRLEHFTSHLRLPFAPSPPIPTSSPEFPVFGRGRVPREHFFSREMLLDRGMTRFCDRVPLGLSPVPGGHV